MGGHNFMGDKRMPSVTYPSFDEFHQLVKRELILTDNISGSDAPEMIAIKLNSLTMRILRAILRAVLLIAYHRIPKPALWEAFGLEQPKDDT